jgi:hypothetical protein
LGDIDIDSIWLASPDDTTVTVYAQKTNGTIRCKTIDTATGEWK